jgi:hypothetical protein
LEFLKRICHSNNLTRESLYVLAQVFSTISRVPFHRDFTRRRTLVIKWFNDHIDQLEPLGPLITLEAETTAAKPDAVPHSGGVL